MSSSSSVPNSPKTEQELLNEYDTIVEGLTPGKRLAYKDGYFYSYNSAEKDKMQEYITELDKITDLIKRTIEENPHFFDSSRINNLTKTIKIRATTLKNRRKSFLARLYLKVMKADTVIRQRAEQLDKIATELEKLKQEEPPTEVPSRARETLQVLETTIGVHIECLEHLSENLLPHTKLTHLLKSKISNIEEIRHELRKDVLLLTTFRENFEEVIKSKDKKPINFFNQFIEHMYTDYLKCLKKEMMYVKLILEAIEEIEREGTQGETDLNEYKKYFAEVLNQLRELPDFFEVQAKGISDTAYILIQEKRRLAGMKPF
jgi:hypothetical protein